MQEVDLNATVTGGRRKFVENGDILDVKLLPDTYTAEWDYFTVGGNNTTKFGTGISLTYAYKENYAWRIFLDYDFTRKTYTMTYDPSRFVFESLGIANSPSDEDLIESQRVRKNRNTFILGGSFTVSF